MSLNDNPQVQAKLSHKLLIWLFAGLASTLALLLLPQLQTTVMADSTGSQINGQICSGGYLSPSLVSTFPTGGSTVTQPSAQITFTADWVSNLTIARGSTTLASVAGSNQANETLSVIVNLNQGTNNLNITITGGCPQANNTISYQLNYTPNSANASSLTTPHKSPQLFGHYSPFGVRVFVVLAGRTYEAIANPDLTWVIPAGVITPDLVDGDYDLRVYTMDSDDNIVFDETYENIITVDTTAPQVSIKTQTSLKSRSPKIEGSVDDPNASVTVQINGYDYTAINRRDGSWYLPAGTIADLSNGSYSVTVTAEDAAGNTASVSTTFRIKAPDQVDFILAPNTGYLRVGQTNIASSYLYMVVFIALVALVWLLTRWRRRLI